jgi:hypothetical protein
MTISITTYNEEQLVLDVLTSAGARGASHEDFVEAGLAGEYVAVIRRLVDEGGLTVRTDFTTGQLRWAMVAGRRLVAA